MCERATLDTLLGLWTNLRSGEPGTLSPHLLSARAFPPSTWKSMRVLVGSDCLLWFSALPFAAHKRHILPSDHAHSFSSSCPMILLNLSSKHHSHQHSFSFLLNLALFQGERTRIEECVWESACQMKKGEENKVMMRQRAVDHEEEDDDADAQRKKPNNKETTI